MNGTVTYRLQVRRKGVPYLNLAFGSLKDAEDWAKKHEYAYIHDPYSYLNDFEKQRLYLRRQREFG